MIKELDSVVLAADVPEHGLKKGDIGTVVLLHSGGACEVEFIMLDGETIAVLSLSPDQIRAVRRREVPHARAVGSAA